MKMEVVSPEMDSEEVYAIALAVLNNKVKENIKKIKERWMKLKETGQMNREIGNIENDIANATGRDRKLIISFCATILRTRGGQAEHPGILNY